MVKISFPDSLKRILLGVVFGFILGTVLYQSSRVQMVTPNIVQAANSDQCLTDKVNGQCPPPLMDAGGNDCYVAPGTACTGENGVPSACAAGVCNAIVDSCKDCNSCLTNCKANGSSDEECAATCQSTCVGCPTACTPGPSGECKHEEGSIGCFQTYTNADCTTTSEPCVCPTSSSSAAACCNSQGRCVY